MQPRDKQPSIQSPARAAAILMLLLTGIYLVWELAFNARLLDVVGEVGDFKQVEALEVWGRLISGLALALVYLGYRLNKEAARGLAPHQLGWRWIMIIVIGITLMAMMFFGQKWLINQLVDSSSAESRRRAAVLVPMTALVKAGRVEFPSLNLSAQDYTTPQGKTFLATLPLQTMSHPDLFPRLEEVGVDRLFGAFAQNTRGSSDEFLKVYRQSVEALEKSYHGAYTDATKAYQRAVGPDAKARKEQAWSDYKNRLRNERRGLHPGNVPRMYWGRVRNDVIASGVPVPRNWNPSDRATFNATVGKAVRERALSEFRNKSSALVAPFGSLDPGLSLNEFLLSPGILASWQSQLKLPNSIKPALRMDATRFETAVYEPAIDADVRQLIRTNYADVRDYEKNGRQFTAGEQAYRSLIVPPVALVFSLLGAVTHIFKIMIFALKVVRRVGPAAYWGSLTGFFFLIGLIPLMATNNITEQKLFQDLQGYTKEQLTGGFVVAAGVRWATQFQPYFYPVNEFARTRILPSPKFDTKLAPL